MLLWMLITSHDSAGGGGPAASSNILDLNWNAVVLYPKGTRSDDVTFNPSITLPARVEVRHSVACGAREWKRCRICSGCTDNIIDSPVIAGEHYRKVELTKAGEIPVHVMDIVADAEADLDMGLRKILRPFPETGGGKR